MANDKRFVAKNGLQTQNIALVSPNASTITASMLDAKTLSFSGAAGQLFSVTDSMGGTIFAVNDISGVPSLEIIDTGTVRIAETTGNVLVGTSTDNTTDKLQVLGNVSISGNLTVSGTSPGGGGISDGDKGDITVSGTGATWTIDNGVVTTAKLATLDPGVIISGSTTGDALRITQTGTGNALVVEDDTNPDATRFAISQNGDVGIGIGPTNFGGYTSVRVSGSTGGILDFMTGSTLNARIFNSSASFIIEAGLAAGSPTIPIVFRTNVNTERLRIASTGAFGLSGANYGTTGQVMTSRGDDSAPSWQNVAIDDLGDVVIDGGTLASNQVLYYNGTNWANDDGSVVNAIEAVVTAVLTPLARSTGGEVVPITVSTTAPTSPATGDLWVDTN